MRRYICLLLTALFLVIVLSLWAEAKLPDYIVFLMTFDEGSGKKVSDLSGYGNNGEVVGSVKWVDGKYGGAFYFDGKTHITVPNADPLKKLTDPMSVGAWVNPETLGGWRNIVEMDGSAGWKFGFHDTTLVWTTYHVKDFIGQTVIPTKKWTHVAAVWDGSKATIYINGEEDQGGPIAGGGKINVEKEPSLDIGFRRTSGSSFYQGAMDDLWIANKALSKNEIQELMNGFTGLMAVNPSGKLATTWGDLKSH
ncbi:LamG domain-containing protein [Candidatus Poribacteria bacterium]|nr:LamG domain-containing protein [Candidatus Poribacteria bacterium]